MTTDTLAKKDVQKLQRTIIDALEDVKAADIVVFDTEHLSSLFERVIVATGSSNRQTRALAASVRDAVKDGGFGKPRIEGEENGEWIVVDCGQAVVHVMQPAIRAYYHLEEIWGDKPVRLKLGSAKPLPKAQEAQPAAPRAATKKASLKTSSAAKLGYEDSFPSKAALAKAAKAGAPALRAAARAAGFDTPMPTKRVAKTAAKTTAKPKTAAALPKRAVTAGKAAGRKTAPSVPKKALSPTSKPQMKVVGKPSVAPVAVKVVGRGAVRAASRTAAAKTPSAVPAARPSTRAPSARPALKTAAKPALRAPAKTAKPAVRAPARPATKVAAKPAVKAAAVKRPAVKAPVARKAAAAPSKAAGPRRK